MISILMAALCLLTGCIIEDDYAALEHHGEYCECEDDSMDAWVCLDECEGGCLTDCDGEDCMADCLSGCVDECYGDDDDGEGEEDGEDTDGSGESGEEGEDTDGETGSESEEDEGDCE